jgi:hypothetical protein
MDSTQELSEVAGAGRPCGPGGNRTAFPPNALTSVVALSSTSLTDKMISWCCTRGPSGTHLANDSLYAMHRADVVAQLQTWLSGRSE